MYRSDVRSSDAAPGDIVLVKSDRGRPLGAAMWSSESQISLRFLGAEAVNDERAWLRDRVAAALAFRATLRIDATAWRAVNGEADLLPGLIVDVLRRRAASRGGRADADAGHGPPAADGGGRR